MRIVLTIALLAMASLTGCHVPVPPPVNLPVTLAVPTLEPPGTTINTYCSIDGGAYQLMNPLPYVGSYVVQDPAPGTWTCYSVASNGDISVTGPFTVPTPIS